MTTVNEYIRLAEAWGTSLEAGDSQTANSLYDRLQALFRLLRESKQETALFELAEADSTSPGARFFIASHIAEADAGRATRIYERLSGSASPFIALSAEHAIAELASRSAS